MKKILSFVMALAMVTSLVATPKVALPNKPMRKARTELAQPVVKKQQPQVKHVAKKHVARKAAIKKMAMATTVSFAPADFEGQGTSGTGSAVSTTKDGVTVSTNLGYGHASNLRVYNGGTLTISASEIITKIEFVFNSEDKDGNLQTVYTPNATTWSATTSEQARINSLVVTLGGDVPPTPPTPSGDVVISGLNYVDAAYYDGFWDFDFYNDYNYEEYYYIYPELYYQANEEATSKTSIVGTWTLYWGGYWKAANDSVMADEENPVGSLTITCVEQGIYNFVGSFVGTDGKTYTWTMNNVEVYAYDGETYEDITLTDGGDGPTPPTPSDTIYTTMNHPLVMDSIADFKWIYVSGENEDYALGIQVNTDHKYGEFTNDDIEYEYTQMIDWAAYDYVDIESIPSVVIAQVEDTLRFTVTVKATDGTVYVITLNDYVTQPTGEETYVDIVLPEVYDSTATAGWFQALGYDVTGEYYASICVNTPNMFGTFTTADMDWQYTGLYLGETTIQLIENSISVTVFPVADTVVYRAEVLDVEGMKWIITMKDYTPTPIEVINLVTVEAQGEYDAEYGDYYAYGTTAGGDQIVFDIYMDKLASGTFTIDDVETYYSGISLSDGTFVEFYSADITLTVSGNDVLIEAVIVGRDIKQYNVTMLIAGGQPGGDHTIVLADYAAVSFTTLDGAYTVLAEKAGASNDPAYNDNSKDLRVYAKGQLTLTSNNSTMTEIVFNISDQGLKRQAEITPSTGTMAYNMDNATVTWTGNATEVTFTVGEKAVHGSESTKAGQFDFTSIDITTFATGSLPIMMNDHIKAFIYKGQMFINTNGSIYNMQGANLH